MTDLKTAHQILSKVTDQLPPARYRGRALNESQKLYFDGVKDGIDQAKRLLGAVASGNAQAQELLEELEMRLHDRELL